METLLRYRGKTITGKEVAFVRRLIEEYPDESRRSLSKRLCRAWTQTNGELRDQVCRSLLLKLDRSGHIQLPGKKCSPHNPLVNRTRPDPPCVDKTPLSGFVCDIGVLRIVQVRRLSEDWREIYGHPIHFVETFVDTERFKGACR